MDKQDYERNHSHTHCWNQGGKPACGQPLEKHKQCCLCDTPSPTVEEGKCKKHGVVHKNGGYASCRKAKAKCKCGKENCEEINYVNVNNPEDRGKIGVTFIERCDNCSHEHCKVCSECHNQNCENFAVPFKGCFDQLLPKKSNSPENEEWRIRFEETKLVTLAGSWLECSDYENTVEEIRKFTEKELKATRKEENEKINAHWNEISKKVIKATETRVKREIAEKLQERVDFITQGSGALPYQINNTPETMTEKYYEGKIHAYLEIKALLTSPKI
ncbi:MAG: hypothetical protein PHN89_05570 [Candidatus Pacebacteria bacterium]|nr:hypothetical protein [Candidatus Paceibacterota bacterium]